MNWLVATQTLGAFQTSQNIKSFERRHFRPSKKDNSFQTFWFFMVPQNQVRAYKWQLCSP